MTATDTDPALRALFVPFELGRLSWPQRGGALFIGARDGWPLHQRPLPGLVCEQDFKPEVDALQRSGIDVREADTQTYPLVLLLPSRQREAARAQYVRALRRLQPGGVLLMCQSNEEGAKSACADLQRLTGALETISKYHCRIAWTQPEAVVDQDLAVQWADLDAPRLIENGRFLSRPGVFAWDRIDLASRLLAEHLPNDLCGAAADLGCGYGYLSSELLAKCQGIDRLDVYEADARALALAESNLRPLLGQRPLGVHWHDVTRGISGSYDVIVCNPPFHTQQARERPDIGRRFIAAAADALRGNGRLWLVANRHLPYESVLDARFADVRTVCQRDGFKVIEALRES